MFYMHDIGWGWEILMVLAMIAFWGLVVYLVVGLASGDRSAKPPTATSPPLPPSAVEILDRRLARGEVDLEEYRALRDAIEHGARGVGAGT